MEVSKPPTLKAARQCTLGQVDGPLEVALRRAERLESLTNSLVTILKDAMVPWEGSKPSKFEKGGEQCTLIQQSFIC